MAQDSRSPNEIEAGRKRLQARLAKCAEISKELQLDPIKPLAANDEALHAAQHFFVKRSSLFVGLGELIETIPYDEMQDCDDQLRTLVLGLSAVKDAILCGSVVRKETFNFHEVLLDYVHLSTKLPWNQRLAAWWEKYKIVTVVSGSILGLVTGIITVWKLFFSNGN